MIDYADHFERTPRRIGRAPGYHQDRQNVYVDTVRLNRIAQLQADTDAAHEHYNEVYRQKKAADAALKQHVADLDRNRPDWLKSYVPDPVFAASTRKKNDAIALKRATLQKLADDKKVQAS